VALLRVYADAEDLAARFEIAPRIAQGTRLNGATRRVVFRVEIQDDRFAAAVAAARLAARSRTFRPTAVAAKSARVADFKFNRHRAASVFEKDNQQPDGEQ
jgi:hypothetical protein